MVHGVIQVLALKRAMLNCFIVKAGTQEIFSSSLLLISRYGILVEPSSSFRTSKYFH